MGIESWRHFGKWENRHPRIRPYLLPTKPDLAPRHPETSLSALDITLAKPKAQQICLSQAHYRIMGAMSPTTTTRNMSKIHAHLYPFSCDQCHSDFPPTITHLFSCPVLNSIRQAFQRPSSYLEALSDNHIFPSIKTYSSTSDPRIFSLAPNYQF